MENPRWVTYLKWFILLMILLILASPLLLPFLRHGGR